MTNCPALAYSRDENTGAIIHNAEACIGCTYCTWACPYDAPKFNENTNIVEKCNFCVHRISENQKPACALACPVGALDYATNVEVDLKKHLTPGFVNAGIRPSIQLIPLRKEHEKPIIENIDAPVIDAERMESYLPKLQSKVDLAKEWTLVLFSLAAVSLVAWQAAALTIQVAISPTIFVLLGIVAIVLSTIHVSKKLRIWRFLLNLKGSWLSREIFSFSAFFGLGALSLFMQDNLFGLGDIFSFVESKTVGIAALVFGAFTLVSVDMVYRFFIRKDTLILHSAMVWITGILLFAWLAHIPLLIGIITLLKASFYIYRKHTLCNQNIAYLPIISSIRIAALLLPCIALLAISTISLWVLLPIVFLGEIIDRTEFYHESDIRTPQGELREVMRKAN